MRRNIIYKTAVLLAVIGISSVTSEARSPIRKAKEGEVLPLWRKGYLDIHTINTGRGESTLYIFPDGTSMLVDAGGAIITKKVASLPTAPKPDASITAGQVITDYLRHFLPMTKDERPGSFGRSKHLDYMMISHFHADHMGSVAQGQKRNEEGGFALTGIAEVGNEFLPDKIIVRADPEEYPSGNMSSEPQRKNIAAFISWGEKKGMVKEAMIPGSTSQIALRKKPSSYPGFHVRNIAANGYVWTGTGLQATTEIPSVKALAASGDINAYPNENILSCMFTLTYGKFDYFAGGDNQYKSTEAYPYLDIERPVSKVVPEVDVMKGGHHLTSGANGKELLEALKPFVVVGSPWRDVQPNPETLGRVYDTSPDAKVFLTNLAEVNIPRIRRFLDRICSTSGHIVVRVCPGGSKYWVYVLEDGDQSYKVNRIFGPYRSR